MKKIVLIILTTALIAPFANAQKSKINLPITWNDTANVDYTVTDFDGTSSTLSADPTSASNLVLITTKSPTGQPWQGTTLSTPTGLDSLIPFAAGATIIKAVIYSPDSGIMVRLKVENSDTATISTETEAMTTVANGWDTLTFNFANQASGQAALNFAKIYDKATIFYDFLNNPAASKTYYLGNVFFEPAAPSSYNVTFQVDMKDVTASYTTPEVNGTFNGWCGNCNSMTDANNDGIWDVTVQLAAGNYEFKYAADSWTIQESLMPGMPCVITTGANTNRILSVSSDTILSAVCWESCASCGSTPPVTKDQIKLPINWDDTATVDYTVTDFNGTSSMLVADPMNASNLVIKTDKSPTGQPWQGTTLSTPLGLADSIPFAAGTTIIKAVVYSPDAGIKVRLKVEDADSSQISVETEATTSIANGWDTLTFDFANQAAGTATINFAKTYNQVTIFYDFQNNPAAAKTYYVDDVYLSTGGSIVTPPDTSSVTFQVDMNTFTGSFTTPEVNGLFNGWCGSCGAMTDVDGDNIWELTVIITGSETEYKFAHDAWTGQETLDSTLSCIKQTGTNINRILSLAGDTTLPAVCWESCETCFPEGIDDNFNANNFKVYPNPSNDFVNISGPRDISELVIMDIIGNVVYSINPNESDLNVPVSNFENGMYIISILDAKGNSSVERFVKQ